MQCRSTLLANSRTKKTAAKKPLVHSFAAAWRVRRAEMEGLARRGNAKGNAAKRINVAMDTTMCKQWSPEEVVLAHTALQRATVYQLFRRRGGTLLCLGRPIDLLLEAWGVPPGHHPHQLHPAELCACKAVEVILNIGLGVESRTTATVTAQKHRGLHLEHDDYGDDADLAKPVRPLEFEDVGGQVVDDDEPRSDDEDSKDRPQGLRMT